MPLVTCQRNIPIPARLAPIWIVRAVSFPFCIAGTQAAASAHRQTRPAPAYKWGPGKSLPARAYVLRGPYYVAKDKFSVGDIPNLDLHSTRSFWLDIGLTSIANKVPRNTRSAPCE